MLELYFNDGNFLPESREEEQSAETVLNIMLAGKTTDTEMCIWPCFYHAPMCKGVLINLDDGTTLRIKPFLNKEGEPEPLLHMRAGSELYLRRAGWKYAKTQMRLFKFMKDSGFIANGQYVKSCVIRSGSALAPNWLRKYIFEKALRK